MSNVFELVHAFFAGKKETAFEIFQQHELRVRKFLQRKAIGEDVEELISRIRLRFIERLPDLRKHDQIEAFILQVTRDELRRHWTRTGRYVALEPVDVPRETDPEAIILKNERISMIRDCIDGLPDGRMKQVARLRYIEGKEQAEICTTLNLTLDQVKKTCLKIKTAITHCVRNKAGQK